MRRRFPARLLSCRLAAALLLVTLSPLTSAGGRRVSIAAEAFTPSPLVAEMLARVDSGEVYSYTAGLSGEQPVTLGGATYTLTSRYTGSGLPIQQATQFVEERLQSLGLAAAYAPWTSGSYSGRNVVGVITGTTHPDEIVLMTAHLDDMPASGLAPGADDNASGSTALLVAAGILCDYEFERTVRFVFFTGEEQTMLGSQQYALDVHTAGENLVGVYNVDMIGWDKAGGPVARLHTRNDAGDLAIADVFTNVVSAYGLSSQIIPVVNIDGMGRSDHASFWSPYDYAAVLAIEDNYSDFNPNYHTASDRLQNLNLAYYTSFVKASVGTVAHLGLPLRRLAGQVSGEVTDSVSGGALAGATVQGVSGVRTYTALASASGVYTFTAHPGIYGLSAWKYGYTFETVTDLEIITDTASTVNFVLAPTQPYTVTGCITDAATGAPLSATVSARGPFGSGLAEVPAPHPAGCYTLTLYGGPYTFSAEAPLHQPATASVNLSADVTQDFALTATTLNGRLWGQITNQTHAPLAGATLRAMPGLAEVTSDATGAYSLDLPPGGYTLTVTAPGYKPLVDNTVSVPQSNLAQYDYALAPLEKIFFPIIGK